MAERATAVVLLCGAGLLLRTLLAVEGVDRGYRAEGVLTLMVDPLSDSYPTPAELLRFYDDVEREVTTLPGVREAAWATTLPLGSSSYGDAFVEELAALVIICAVVGKVLLPRTQAGTEHQPVVADYGQ